MSEHMSEARKKLEEQNARMETAQAGLKARIDQARAQYGTQRAESSKQERQAEEAKKAEEEAKRAEEEERKQSEWEAEAAKVYASPKVQDWLREELEETMLEFYRQRAFQGDICASCGEDLFEEDQVDINDDPCGLRLCERCYGERHELGCPDSDADTEGGEIEDSNAGSQLTDSVASHDANAHSGREPEHDV